LDVFYSLTIVLTSLLFFFRVRAVFNKNPWIVALFVGLWLSVLAGCSTLVVGVNAVHIGPTKFCTTSEVKPFAAAASIIPLINDTLVFLVMTWRLSRNSYACRTFEHDVRALVFGDYLPMFSKAMLQGGQAYYLLVLLHLMLMLNQLTSFPCHRTSVAVNLATVIMLYNRSIPSLLRTVITVPNVTLTNIMACRVFRDTLLGVFEETQSSTTLGSTMFERHGSV